MQREFKNTREAIFHDKFEDMQEYKISNINFVNIYRFIKNASNVL